MYLDLNILLLKKKIEQIKVADFLQVALWRAAS